MTRLDSLRVLLAAELPRDVRGVEVLLRAIAARIDELEPGSDAYAAVHRYLDRLLAHRDALQSVETGGG